MAIEFPPECAWLFAILTGEVPPDGDEDKMFALAQVHQDLNGKLNGEFQALVADALGFTKDKFGGDAAQMYEEAMKTFLGGQEGLDYFKAVGDQAQLMADFTRKSATQLQYMKYMIIAQLVALLIEAAFAAATAFFFGASIAVYMQKMAIVRWLIKTWIGRAILTLLTHQFINVGMGVAMDSMIQWIQLNQGTRDEWDTDLTKNAALSGMVQGFLAGPFNFLGDRFGKFLAKRFGLDAGPDLGKQIDGVLKKPDPDVPLPKDKPDPDVPLSKDKPDPDADGSTPPPNAGKPDPEGATPPPGGTKPEPEGPTPPPHPPKPGTETPEPSPKPTKNDSDTEKAPSPTPAAPFSRDLTEAFRKHLPNTHGPAGPVVQKEFVKDVGEAFRKQFGDGAGDDIARKAGEDWARALLEKTGTKGLPDDLGNALKPIAGELGDDLTKVLTKGASDALGLSIMRTIVEGAGRGVFEGAHAVVSEGMYNLIFSDEHTFKTSGLTFASGMVEGRLGAMMEAGGENLAMNTRLKMGLDTPDWDADGGVGTGPGTGSSSAADDGPDEDGLQYLDVGDDDTSLYGEDEDDLQYLDVGEEDAPPSGEDEDGLPGDGQPGVPPVMTASGPAPASAGSSGTAPATGSPSPAGGQSPGASTSQNTQTNQSNRPPGGSPAPSSASGSNAQQPAGLSTVGDAPAQAQEGTDTALPEAEQGNGGPVPEQSARPDTESTVPSTTSSDRTSVEDDGSTPSPSPTGDVTTATVGTEEAVPHPRSEDAKDDAPAGRDTAEAPPLSLMSDTTGESADSDGDSVYEDALDHLEPDQPGEEDTRTPSSTSSGGTNTPVGDPVSVPAPSPLGPDPSSRLSSSDTADGPYRRPPSASPWRSDPAEGSGGTSHGARSASAGLDGGVMSLEDFKKATASSGFRKSSSIAKVDSALKAFHALPPNAGERARLDAAIGIAKASEDYVQSKIGSGEPSERLPGVRRLREQARTEVARTDSAMVFQVLLTEMDQVMAAGEHPGLKHPWMTEIALGASQNLPADRFHQVMSEYVRALGGLGDRSPLPEVTSRVIQEVMAGESSVTMQYPQAKSGVTLMSKEEEPPAFIFNVDTQIRSGTSFLLGHIAHELTHVAAFRAFNSSPAMELAPLTSTEPEIKALVRERGAALDRLSHVLDASPFGEPMHSLLKEKLGYGRQPGKLKDYADTLWKSKEKKDAHYREAAEKQAEATGVPLTEPVVRVPDAREITATERDRLRLWDGWAGDASGTLVEYDTVVNQMLVYLHMWGTPLNNPFYTELREAAETAYARREHARRNPAGPATQTPPHAGQQPMTSSSSPIPTTSVSSSAPASGVQASQAPAPDSAAPAWPGRSDQPATMPSAIKPPTTGDAGSTVRGPAAMPAPGTTRPTTTDRGALAYQLLSPSSPQAPPPPPKADRPGQDTPPPPRPAPATPPQADPRPPRAVAERTMPPVRADELAGVDDASWAAVRTERFDPVLGQSNRRPGLLDGSETLIRNHVRREHLQDGRTVRHFVVTLPVKPTGNLGDADVRGLETRLQKMLDQTLNSGYKLPRSGDQLRVTLELEPVSRHGEAITLTQSRNPGRADQLHWDVEHGDGTLVHEVLHYLGLPDEYLDTVDGKKSDATHLFRRDGRLTGVHETGPMSRTERADLDALAVDHLKRIEDISDTANIPSHAAHTVPPQSSDTTGAQPPAQNSPSNSGADPSTSSHRRSRLVPDNDPAHPVSASPWHGHAGAGPGTGQPYGAPSSSGANPVFVPPRFQRQNTFTVQQTSSDFIANVQVSSNYQAPNVLLHNVNIGDIRLSNQDRPDTQYSFLDRGQQNHTVAWTLIRDALKYHEHRPAADLIGYIELGLQSLDRQNNQESYIDTTRGAHARFSEAMRKAEELLREIKVNQAPLGEWQQALAKLISLYVEAYQLSPSATFGGRSGGNAEANSMRILRRQNTLPENERMSSGELASLVESLYDSPPIARHKEHSREHLLHAVAARFPNLVYPLSSQYPEYHNMRQNYPGINQALAQGFFQSEFLDSRQGNDALLARLPYGVLDSGFVVNAEVDRDAQNNLGIAHLEMSRRERPPTQYISAQRSHVMAWSLVMNSTRGALIQKPVADALLWVWGRLQHCEAAGGPVAALDDWNALGHGIRQKLDVAEQLLATEPSPQFWSSLLSMLIHGCLTLENSSRLATTGGPAGDLGAAVGHGEARTHERMMHGGSMQQEEAREVARGFLDDGAIRTTIINEIMKNAGRPIRGQPAVDPMLRIEAFNQRLDSDPGIRVILNNMAQAVSSAYPNVQFGDRESLVDYWHARMRAVPDGDSNSSGTPFNEAERALLWLP